MKLLDSLATVGTAATIGGAALPSTDEVVNIGQIILGIVTGVMQIILFFKKRKEVKNG